jgi:hypothetical protein
LTVKNRDGSVEHYYHFLLGFLVPLVGAMSARGELAHCSEIIVRTCGPMDRLLDELDIEELLVVDKLRHESSLSAYDPGDRIVIEGYDRPCAYDRAVFLRAAAQLREILSTRITDILDGPLRSWPPGGRLLLIQRGPGLPFYRSTLSESPGSGQERRSIGNHVAFRHALSTAFTGCLNVSLERASLAFQIALFGNADVVVAQHGAALANLLWARPGTRVIEVYPDDLPENKAGYFSNLAACVGAEYSRIIQNGRYGAIDPALVVEMVRARMPTVMERPVVMLSEGPSQDCI